MTPASSRSGRPEVTAACSPAPSRFRQTTVLTETTAAVTVTGTDISAEYTDFRDDSGSIITVSASAGIRSNTGSVSLDRTVYPVPIGDDRDTDTDFATHTDDTLGQHDLTIYVSINDADSDTSSNGIDSIDASTLEISVIRGSDTEVLTITESTIDETAPNSGIFEHTQTISYAGGPDSTDCPIRPGRLYSAGRHPPCAVHRPI